MPRTRRPRLVMMSRPTVKRTTPETFPAQGSTIENTAATHGAHREVSGGEDATERSVHRQNQTSVMGKSLFILWITGPRSSVRPSLTRAWWLSATGYVAALEPPPGRGGRQWLGSLPRHSAGVGIPKSHCQVTRSAAILAHSIPSPSSHGSAMARTGRKSLIHTKSKKISHGVDRAGDVRERISPPGASSQVD